MVKRVKSLLFREAQQSNSLLSPALDHHVAVYVAQNPDDGD